MNKKITIHIPEPCHQDWQEMTPADKGRFCQSCAKQVVDFSLMTDQQVLNFISKAPGRVCGRFADDQLQRPLQPVRQEKKKIWWMAAVLPLAMVFARAAAQKKKNVKQDTASTKTFHFRRTMGMIALPNIRPVQNETLLATANIIKGRVITENGNALPFATVRAVNQPLTVIADSNGSFAMELRSYTGTIEIEASTVGFENARISVDAEQKSNVTLVLKESENKLPEVVVTGYGLRMLVGRLGGLQIIRTDTLVEKFDTLIRQAFHTEPFKIFPNPAKAGQNITVDTKTEGEFSIQLFDNTGRFLQVKEFDATEGATQTQLAIPQSYAPGIYYIRLIDTKTKKQVTSKMVVM